MRQTRIAGWTIVGAFIEQPPPTKMPTCPPTCLPFRRLLGVSCFFLVTTGTGISPRLFAASPTPAVKPSDENPSDKAFDAVRAAEFFERYCTECHQGDDGESGLDLSQFRSAKDVTDSIASFQRIAGRITDGQMPPEGSEAPPDELKKQLTEWIHQTIHQSVCDDGVSPDAQ